MFNYSTWILSSSHQSWARRSWTFRDFPWARSLSRFFINWVKEAWVVNIGFKYYKPGKVGIWPKNKIFKFFIYRSFFYIPPPPDNLSFIYDGKSYSAVKVFSRMSGGGGGLINLKSTGKLFNPNYTFTQKFIYFAQLI